MSWQVGPLSIVYAGIFSTKHINQGCFDDIKDAYNEAIVMSGDEPMGLWTSQSEGSELLSVFVCGQEFKND